MNELNYSSSSSSEDESTEVVVNDSVLKITLAEYGQNHPDWLSHLDGFKSGGVYSFRVLDMLWWYQLQSFESDDTDLLAGLKLYIKKSREETVVKNGILVPKWVPTTYRGWMSMFHAFWKFTGFNNNKY